jgi:hypothetical protein
MPQDLLPQTAVEFIDLDIPAAHRPDRVVGNRGADSFAKSRMRPPRATGKEPADLAGLEICRHWPSLELLRETRGFWLW